MKNALASRFAVGWLAVTLCPAQVPPAGYAELGNQKLAQLGVLDVTAKPFQADPTGQRDSTDALQKAIDFARDKRMVAFFPLGTYRVSGTLTAVKSTSRMSPCLLVGEQRRVRGKGVAARPVNPGER